MYNYIGIILICPLVDILWQSRRKVQWWRGWGWFDGTEWDEMGWDGSFLIGIRSKVHTTTVYHIDLLVLLPSKLQKKKNAFWKIFCSFLLLEISKIYGKNREQKDKKASILNRAYVCIPSCDFLWLVYCCVVTFSTSSYPRAYPYRKDAHSLAPNHL